MCMITEGTCVCLCVYLNWLQQQAGTQEAGKTGDEPHHGHTLIEPMACPNRNAIRQSDPCPAAPQGGTSTPGRETPRTAHVCHNWKGERTSQGCEGIGKKYFVTY